MKLRTPDRAPEADIVRVEQKRFRRRRLVRRLVALRPLLISLAVLAVVGGMGWLLFYSSVLTVEKVEIRGTDVLSVSDVRRQADVPRGEQLARVDTDAIQARVEDLAPVKAADVSRCWPDTICIDVTERASVAVVDREGSLWGLDDTGILFRQYAKRPAGLPVVHMRAATSTDALAEAAAVVAALPSTLAKRVDYLDVLTVDEISLRLRSGATVVWGSADQSDEKARVLEALVDAEPDARIYNVSAPGKPTARVG